MYPQLASVGPYNVFLEPRHLKIVGRGVRIGSSGLFFAAADNYIRLTTWHHNGCDGRLEIGNNVLITPGVRLAAAECIELGDGCMLASECYVSDCDWHGIYDRAFSLGQIRPVRLRANVWLGTRAMVCKGVEIGENSIVAAGAVVTKDVPANVVVAGVPARKVADLDADHPRVTRNDMFANPDKILKAHDYLERLSLADNTLTRWLKARWAPTTDD